jgi:hypothetical protein
VKIIGKQFIRIDDEHDRDAAIYAGLKVEARVVGGYSGGRRLDVINCETADNARRIISDLNSRACVLRTKARRAAAEGCIPQMSLERKKDIALAFMTEIMRREMEGNATGINLNRFCTQAGLQCFEWNHPQLELLQIEAFDFLEALRRDVRERRLVREAANSHTER